MRFLALASSALFLLAAGCGSEETREPAVEGTATTPTATVPDSAPAVVALYFLRDGKVGLVRRGVAVEKSRIAHEEEPETAAMRALLDGPTPADRKAGFDTAIPRGVPLESLEISDGTATVHFLQDSALAEAQAVFTLTQFPSVERVSIDHRLVRRADFEDYTPAILVESPAPWENVSNPVRITGTANTFEATFNVEVVDDTGKVLGKRFVTATSGSGTRGTFDAEVKFRTPTSGSGRLVVYESSAEDGETRLHEVEIPLGLQRP